MCTRPAYSPSVTRARPSRTCRPRPRAPARHPRQASSRSPRRRAPWRSADPRRASPATSRHSVPSLPGCSYDARLELEFFDQLRCRFLRVALEELRAFRALGQVDAIELDAWRGDTAQIGGGEALHLFRLRLLDAHQCCVAQL